MENGSEGGQDPPDTPSPTVSPQSPGKQQRGCCRGKQDCPQHSLQSRGAAGVGGRGAAMASALLTAHLTTACGGKGVPGKARGKQRAAMAWAGGLSAGGGHLGRAYG